MTHRPQMTPLDSLTGRWRVERAVAGEPINIGRRAGRLWRLELLHIETGHRHTLLCKALRHTHYTQGQEIDGHAEITREGDFFRRHWPAVGPSRRKQD